MQPVQSFPRETLQPVQSRKSGPRKILSTMTAADLAALQSRLGMTQAQLADAIGISPRHLANHLSGAAPIPLTTALACAAVALGLRDYPSR